MKPSAMSRLRDQSINRLIPNILTLLALCAGLTAIRFAIYERWEAAVIAIVAAGILDGLDGRIARLLDSTSRFGAELDSLADFVSFGVAPAMLLYFWCLADAGALGWAAVLLFCICTALRLARFNTRLDDPDLPSWAGRFFTGVPAPAAAGLALLPMMASFEFGGGFFDQPLFVGLVCAAVAALMISNLPTFSLKRIKIAQRFVLPVLIGVGIATAFLVSETWGTLIAVGLAYLVCLPIAYVVRRRLIMMPNAPSEEDLAEETDVGPR